MIQAPFAQIQPSQPQPRTAEPAQTAPEDFAGVLTRHQEPDAAPPDAAPPDADVPDTDAVETTVANGDPQPVASDETANTASEAPEEEVPADAPGGEAEEAAAIPASITSEPIVLAHTLPDLPRAPGRVDASIATAPTRDAPTHAPQSHPNHQAQNGAGPQMVQGAAGRAAAPQPVSDTPAPLPTAAPIDRPAAQTAPPVPADTPPPPPSTQVRTDGPQGHASAAASSPQATQSRSDTSSGDFSRDDAPRQQASPPTQVEAKPAPQAAPESPQPIFRLVPQDTTAQMPRTISAEVAQQTDAGPRLAADADAEPPALASIRRGLGTVLSQRGGSLTMRLTPATLGSVRIDMAIDGTTVNVRIEAGTSQAQDLLKQNLTSLRTALEARGLVVDRLGVHVSAHASNAPLQTESQTDPGTQRQDDARHDASDGRSRGSSDGREQPEDERGGAAEGQPHFSDVLQQGVKPDGDGWRLSLDATV
jgi:flagellar hook-length control protein FliK